MTTHRQLLIGASLGIALIAPGLIGAAQPAQRTFAKPEEAVRALIDAAKAGSLDGLRAVFGPDSDELIASSDGATARANRDVFTVAVAEGWRLVDQDGRRTLVVGNEGWPFPVPIVKTAGRWKFDTAAGKEEVLARRIGRNELAVIGICRTYVAAQYHYAREGHDSKPASLFAMRFASDPGMQNGLYWPEVRGEARSPLGEMVAQAAAEGRALGTEPRMPFHGYYFRILTAQGPAAPGGAKSYVAGSEMTGGFALLAWPAQYDASGVMTFAVNQDGVVYETDLGEDTAAAAAAITTFSPDASWRPER
jgi:Protein of unknown function (DUF2950)